MNRKNSKIILASIVLICVIVVITMVSKRKENSNVYKNNQNVAESNDIKESASSATQILEAVLNSKDADDDSTLPESSSKNPANESAVGISETNEDLHKKSLISSESVSPQMDSETTTEALSQESTTNNEIAVAKDSAAVGSRKIVKENSSVTELDAEEEIESETEVVPESVTEPSSETTTETQAPEENKPIEVSLKKKIKSYEDYEQLSTQQKKELYESFDTPQEYNDWLTELIQKRNDEYEKDAGKTDENVDKQQTGK